VIVVTGDHSRIEEIEKSGHRHVMKPYRLSTLLELADETLKAAKAQCERLQARRRIAISACNRERDTRRLRPRLRGKPLCV
jgi:hypothetical protein